MNILGNTLANDRTKRRHMQNEQANLKTQIQQKQKDIAELQNEMSNIKNKSMSVDERLNKLNKIYEVPSGVRREHVKFGMLELEFFFF